MFAPLLLGAAVTGAAAAGTVVSHYRESLGPFTLREVRLLAKLPTTLIGDAREGFVKVCGTVGCDTPTPAVFGAMPVAVRELRHYGIEGRGASAHRVLRRVERTPGGLWVDDGSGRVTLDPTELRVDYEVEGAAEESMVEEHRLRVGERVAVLGTVRREGALAEHPLRASRAHGDAGLRFEPGALLTWRTEPEVYPRLVPPLGSVALSASSVGMAVLGALLRL
ncbi:MAG: hypothetical protein HY909_03330 [Deltaproteobacteria bacterium]|nr:hypothetical protein [Deltaproteobacteria bacterium]